jgi:integrase/recombinase XerD
MSNAGIPLRIIQKISGHSNLEQLQRYLDVKPDQVKGAIASLSMLSYTGKPKFSLLILYVAVRITGLRRG